MSVRTIVPRQQVSDVRTTLNSPSASRPRREMEGDEPPRESRAICDCQRNFRQLSHEGKVKCMREKGRERERERDRERERERGE